MYDASQVTSQGVTLARKAVGRIGVRETGTIGAYISLQLHVPACVHPHCLSAPAIATGLENQTSGVKGENLSDA